MECVDWTGGQIKNDDSSDDVKNVDLSQVHYLSGPVEVEGAKPGKSLVQMLFTVIHSSTQGISCLQATFLKLNS